MRIYTLSLLFLFFCNSISAESLYIQSQEDADNYVHTSDTINGSLFISGWDLTDLSNLNRITTITGTLQIGETDSLVSLSDLSNLKIVGGGLRVWVNKALTDVSALSTLDSIGTYIYFGYNNKLENIHLSPKIQELNGDLTISTNQNLRTISGLSNLTTINGNFDIWENPNLSSISILPSIEEITGFIRIYNNDKLLTFNALSHLKTLNGGLTVTNQDLLTILDFNSLKEIGGSMTIYVNSNLANLDRFNSLALIGLGLNIESNDELNNINGLNKIREIRSFIRISRNPKLKNIDGLIGLSQPIGNLYIKNNQSLLNLDGLQNISEVKGDLNISYNDVLQNIDGLRNISNISEDIKISYNPTLQNLDGLNAIKAVKGNLVITANPTLTNSYGLSNISSIGENFTYTFNNKVTDFLNKNNLTTIEGTFLLDQNYSIKSLEGLSNLTHIGGDLFLRANSSLENLDQFANLKSVGANLRLWSNPRLFDCCGIVPLLSNRDSIKGEISINNTPLPCSSEYEILNSECSDLVLFHGKTVLDNNMDGCDTLDPVQGNIPVYSQHKDIESRILTDSNGAYQIYSLSNEDYKLFAYIEYPYYNISPDTIYLSIPEDSLNLENDFCITPNGDYNDLEITLIPLNVARPGFTVDYKIIYKNVGTLTQSGVVRFVNNNDSVSVFESCNPTCNSVSAQVYEWDFFDLKPFEQRVCNISFSLNTPIDTIPLNAGDYLKFKADVLTTNLDETPTNNSSSIVQTVINSFDPNNKVCLEGSRIDPDRSSDYLSYIIRFENIGSAPAVNVKVTDYINPNMYDINTLKVLDASHSLETRIQGDSVEFYFSEIELSHIDSINDGYIVFKIKIREHLTEGDELSNFANIYFDFNAPIRTNTAKTDIRYSSVRNIFKSKNVLDVAPNPANRYISMQVEPSEKYRFFLMNNYGQVIRKGELNTYNNEVQLNILDLATGFYTIHLLDKGGTSFSGRFIKVE